MTRSVAGGGYGVRGMGYAQVNSLRAFSSPEKPQHYPLDQLCTRSSRVHVFRAIAFMPPSESASVLLLATVDSSVNSACDHSTPGAPGPWLERDESGQGRICRVGVGDSERAGKQHGRVFQLSKTAHVTHAL